STIPSPGRMRIRAQLIAPISLLSSIFHVNAVSKHRLVRAVPLGLMVLALVLAAFLWSLRGDHAAREGSRWPVPSPPPASSYGGASGAEEASSPPRSAERLGEKATLPAAPAAPVPSAAEHDSAQLREPEGRVRAHPDSSSRRLLVERRQEYAILDRELARRDFPAAHRRLEELARVSEPRFEDWLRGARVLLACLEEPGSAARDAGARFV